MNKTSLYLFFVIFLQSCIIQKNIISTQIPTEDICPIDNVKFWWGYMKQIEEDTTLLYDVADSCNDSECYKNIAEHFWEFSDTYIDNMGKPPECVSLFHEIIRQNLRDEGEAFFAESEKNLEKANSLRKRVLGRMDEIDRLIKPILEEGLNTNNMKEIFIAAQTQTAIPDVNSLTITQIPKIKPTIRFGDYFTFQLDEGWCIYNDFVDVKENLVFNIVNNCYEEPHPSIITQIVEMGDDYEDEYEIMEEWKIEGESLGLKFNNFGLIKGIDEIFIGENKVYAYLITLQDSEIGPEIVLVFNINDKYFYISSSFTPLPSTFSPKEFPQFYPEDFEYTDSYLLKESLIIIQTIKVVN